MATFNIIKATQEGYKYIWDSRLLILKLGAMPVMVKFISYAVIIMLGLESNILRQGLVLFPAYLLEGYLVCALLRYAIYSHESQIQPPGAEAYQYYKQRALDIQAGAIIYTLLKLIAAFAVGLLLNFVDPEQAEKAAGPASFENFFLMMICLYLALWGFRLIWIYIPTTLGFSSLNYLKKVRGMSFSFHILSVWIMCILPLTIFMLLCSDILRAMTGHSADLPSQVYIFAMLGVQSVLETVMAVLSSIGIGFGIYAILSNKVDQKGNWT